VSLVIDKFCGLFSIKREVDQPFRHAWLLPVRWKRTSPILTFLRPWSILSIRADDYGSNLRVFAVWFQEGDFANSFGWVENPKTPRVNPDWRFCCHLGLWAWDRFCTGSAAWPRGRLLCLSWAGRRGAERGSTSRYGRRCSCGALERWSR